MATRKKKKKSLTGRDSARHRNSKLGIGNRLVVRRLRDGAVNRGGRRARASASNRSGDGRRRPRSTHRDGAERLERTRLRRRHVIYSFSICMTSRAPPSCATRRLVAKHVVFGIIGIGDNATCDHVMEFPVTPLHGPHTLHCERITAKPALDFLRCGGLALTQHIHHTLNIRAIVFKLHTKNRSGSCPRSTLIPSAPNS